MNSWIVYIVRCVDDSLYTGITNNIRRRIDEHNNNNRTASAYTRARRPVNLVYKETYSTRSLASKREYEIKQFSKNEKEALLSTVPEVVIDD